MRLKFGIAMLLSACASIALAQNTNSADIRGVTTDQTGAVLPGVNVTVLNVTKNVTDTYVTNGAGLYDTGPIVPDNYTVTFSHAGFKSLVRGPLTLQVGSYTVNGQLDVGAATQQVVVNTDIPLLNTESAAQSTALPTMALQELPTTSTNWEDFIILMPGTTGVAQGGNSVTNPQANASINGNMPYNAVLSDGSAVLLFYSYNTGNQSIYESLAEVDTQASTFSAQYGMGGAVFNQVSKGGSSQFHGTLYEFFKNNAMNAANYGFGAKVTVPILKYNHFGGNVGGPVPLKFLKNKAFFFFDYDKTIQNSGSSGFVTVPTLAMRSGDFTGQNTIYDPTTQTYVGGVLTRTSFASEYGNGNKIPTALQNSVALAFQNTYFPKPNTPGTTANGVTTNNYYYNVPTSTKTPAYFGRLDYDISANNRLTMSDTTFGAVSFSQNIGVCPVDCYTADSASNNAQVTDVWTIRPDMVNELRWSYADSYNWDVPASYNTSTNIPATTGLQFSKANIFPQFGFTGGLFGSSSPGSGYMMPGPTAVYRQHTFDPSDVFTLIRGRHVLKFGGEVFMMQCNCTVWNNVNGASLTYNGVYTASTKGTSSTSGASYADYLLGWTNTWSAYTAPPFHALIKNPQIFAEDTIKLRPNLTLDAGLRWQGTTGIEDKSGNMYSFDPTVLNPVTNTPGAMWYASTHANGRTTLQAPVWNTFLPRVGVSYQWRSNTVIRGGFGLFAYGWSHDTNGNGDGAAYASSGSLTDSTNGVQPIVTLSDTGNTVYSGQTKSVNAGFILPTTNPAAFNGSGVTYNHYHTPVSRMEQWNLEVQRELGADMVINVAYVGAHGFNLVFGTDLNAVPLSLLGPNDNPSGRPYPAFGSIAGSTDNAVSNYNALQASVSRRMSHGLAFAFNYTWSHFLSSQDSAGWGTRGGSAPYQNAYVPSANYGNSNFDVPQMFKGNVIYALPFGKGQPFLNNNLLADYAIGGWRLSGIIIAQAGNPFTPTMSTNNTYSQASGSSQYPNVVGSPTGQGFHTVANWFNVAAFSAPAPGTFGNMARNSLFGPGLSEVNLSMAKSFPIWRESSLQIRGETTNAFNHPSWAQPDTVIGSGHVGAIRGVTVGGRVMQLVARMTF